jgi:hypothetical protein
MELEIKTVPKATNIFRSDVLRIGFTAAMAQLPQITVPILIS